MSIRTWIRDWLYGDNPKVSRAVLADNVAEPTVNDTSISINNAINGKVLTLRTYKPNSSNHRSDWTTEYYVLKEDESLPEAITMLLLLKGMK